MYTFQTTAAKEFAEPFPVRLQASQQTNHPGCDTQGTSSTMDEDCVIGAIFVDLSKAFALAGHKLPLGNFRNVGPCRDCIR